MSPGVGAASRLLFVGFGGEREVPDTQMAPSFAEGTASCGRRGRVWHAKVLHLRDAVPQSSYEIVPIYRYVQFSAAWGVLLVGILTGCEPPTRPSEAPEEYNRLVQVAAAQAEGRPDTSFFWLSNTSVTTARTLMLDLGIDYLRYDRSADAFCVWKGEGLWPARGYVTAPSSGRVPADSVSQRCNIEGTCTTEPVTGQWLAFRCE